MDVMTDSRWLRSQGMSGVRAIWSGLEAPPLAALDGEWRGAVVATAAERLLGGLWGPVALNALGGALAVWRGKRFDGARGVNVWVKAGGPLCWASYQVHAGDALDGEGDAVVLDYDLPQNVLPPLRAARGEVRELGPGLLLGRMSVELGDGAVPLLYFTLRR